MGTLRLVFLCKLLVVSKRSCFTPGRLFLPNLMFVGMTRILGYAPALQEILKLGLKGLPGTSTSLLAPFVSYEENKLLWICTQLPTLLPNIRLGRKCLALKNVQAYSAGACKAQLYKTFLRLSFTSIRDKLVFVPCEPLQPSLMFAGKRLPEWGTF